MLISNFGYQPASKSSTPPFPPTSGSNIVKPQNNTKSESIKWYIECENCVVKIFLCDTVNDAARTCEKIIN